MDTFVAALKVGQRGRVIGIDMTDAQLDKAQRLRAAAGFSQVTYRKGHIDKASCADASADAVISNGVINLAPDKAAVFREAARLLKPGGRLAIADIGGAMQRDDYRAAIEAAGLRVEVVRDNAGYQFISENAQGAQQRWGVKSISLLAAKP
jgi:ubiquinone/menaquinone biosynthesis C-methylase UbiE